MPTPTIGVYVITNTSNGKVYVGQSVNCKERWKSHQNQFRNGKHFNKHLQRAYDKYGEASFTFYLLEMCDQCDMDERERYWIELLQASNPDLGYNKELGGSKGKKASKELRERMAEISRLRFTLHGNHLKGYAKNRLGRHHSIETKARISSARSGIRFTAEHKAKLSAAKKGRPLTSEHREKLRRRRLDYCYNRVPVSFEMKTDVKNGMSLRAFCKKYGTRGAWYRAKSMVAES